MYIATHDQVTASVGENVKIVLDVTDLAGGDIDVSTATAAVYKLARRLGGTSILEKTKDSGITLTDNTATIEFNTNEVLISAVQVLGDLIGHISITKSGDLLYIAKGIVTITPVND